MNEYHKEFLEWLIEDIDFTTPMNYRGVLHVKDIVPGFSPPAILELESIIYRGAPLFSREDFVTVNFYPGTIKDYLKEKFS